jgi:2-dehydro-3-deoxy-D-arabinonate dehydratase
MQICRFHVPNTGPRLGLLQDETVYDLTASEQPHFTTLAALLQTSTTTPLESLLRDVELQALPSYSYADLNCEPGGGVPFLLPPVDQQEVWAAGVTYAWSREARVREAVTKDIYVRVYEAERPEIFFKSPGEKAVGPHNWIGLRGDSKWNVPEPELVLVLNPQMQIVGYTVGNDVSSRDIEGENPLYLPQAKYYRHACAVGPVITVADDTIDAKNLTIRLVITRDGNTVFESETSTANIHRALPELAEYLGRYNDFPQGALLFTGTGIVPPDDFTLHDGDDVTITIEGIGALRNTVRQME